jgi:CheY-like chemotaxis protein
MMPDMDGVEATALIREWEKERQLLGYNGDEIPIIALTANAVSGVREMFIEKGFNDFLAKPIDISALDDILNRWISKDKRESYTDKAPGEKSSLFLIIDGLDTKKGINMTGGKETGYISVLSTFRRDAQDRLQILRKTFEDSDISMFITHVHALKGAAASIGAMDISAEAAKLEHAGRDGDITAIHTNLDRFIEKLSKLIDGINSALEAGKTETNNCKSLEKTDELYSLLVKLAETLKTRKAEEIDSLLDKINKLPMDDTTREAVEKISDDILMTEFESAAKAAEKIINGK